MLNSRIIALPLLDSHSRIMAVARRATDGLQIGSHHIGDDAPCFQIAEIGNNHNGDIDTAHQLIDAAHAAKADCAKFQMRDMSRLYRNAGDSNDMASHLGTEYTLDLLERFQLSDDELFRCFDHGASKGLVPLCTPWDETSLDKLNRWGMKGFKVASADLTNRALLSSLAANDKPLICSTGMASEVEFRAGHTQIKTRDTKRSITKKNKKQKISTKPIHTEPNKSSQFAQIKNIITQLKWRESRIALNAVQCKS